MPASDLRERLQRLNVLLDETVTLLNRYGESHWAAWLATSKPEITAHDTHALDRLLSAFGGMGSFNDLVVMNINGHHIQQAQEATVNRRLTHLRTSIWVEATTLRREIRQVGE